MAGSRRARYEHWLEHWHLCTLNRHCLRGHWDLRLGGTEERPCRRRDRSVASAPRGFHDVAVLELRGHLLVLARDRLVRHPQQREVRQKHFHLVRHLIQLDALPDEIRDLVQSTFQSARPLICSHA
eukprot:2057058-Rhodomonas_salina.7